MIHCAFLIGVEMLCWGGKAVYAEVAITLRPCRDPIARLCRVFDTGVATDLYRLFLLGGGRGC